MAPLRQHDMRLRSATTDEIKEVWEERWYGLVVGLNTNYAPEDVEGLALVDHLDDVVGLVTYHVDGPSGQIVTSIPLSVDADLAVNCSRQSRARFTIAASAAPGH